VEVAGGRIVDAKPGDRIIVESEKVGQRTREGEILEVVQSPFGVSYDVRWDDGRRTSFRPAAGSARIVQAAPKPRRRRAGATPRA
jgi:hypothetical protein